MTSNATNGTPANSDNDANNNSSSAPGPANPFQLQAKASRWHKTAAQHSAEQAERNLPRSIFDPDGGLVCYWTAAVAMATLYNAWTIALRISFPIMREANSSSYLPYVDIICDLTYLLDILFQLRTAYLQDGIPVYDPSKIRQHYMSQTRFIQDVISVLPSQSILAFLPDSVGWCKYFFCTVGGARLNKLLKFHILYKFYDLAESFTSNPHLIRVLRLFLNLAIIIHWIACLYYLLSEYEGLGSNAWVYTNSTEEQRFSRKYIICLYWSAMTLTTIGNTNPPETDVEYIFTGVIFLTGVFVFATVMGNVGDVISSMNANRQEFQARMDHIQMYLTHKKVPASLQLKIKKWAEYTWTRTKATDESRLLNMLPERLRAEVAVHVHLDSLKKVKIFEQCETGFLCELVLKLRSQVFSPGDYVCRVGETGREMFIINHGKVEVIVNNPATGKPMVVAVLSEGNYFGEISLLRLDGVQNRRTADVRSIGYSELLCLSRRDLMSALVEYPEAKSVLEDQAKKRMKTNLQAQRAFSVDALLRNSQEHSSMDSGIVKDEERGQEVSEIKAMIEELKNANKVPGRTVWQLIARCEVLQAKLGEKEKEVEESKFRIKELEQLLFSHHYPKYSEETESVFSPDPERNRDNKQLRSGSKVVKQYSQDEGRQLSDDGFSDERADPVIPEVRTIPQLKITRPSSEGGSSNEGDGDLDKKYMFKDDNFIRTSKITNVYEKGNSSKVQKQQLSSSSTKEEEKPSVSKDFYSNNFQVFTEKIWDLNPSMDYSFTNETLIDHQIMLDDNEEITLSTRFKDEFSLNDSSLNLNVHTIPEESEEELNDVNVKLCSSNEDGAKDCQESSKLSSDHSANSEEERNLQTQIPRTCSVDNLSSMTANKTQHLSPGGATEGMKRLQSAPGDLRHLDTLKTGEAIDFLRMASMSSGYSYSDDTSSRRNSWTWGSECDTDEEYASS
ncbi:cyclic nucleotide-gated cation channel alpha-3 [Nephila pilipes]|uniref:Cyclic nucleotide-gated cation channel alpha-3 n=1 Tax=Nephila pilipes TaxID=299642 RepID=A0A8X6U5K0_NEPPI|nr:cyclic nucleotide-gated cation channel alpha-3 [Nephila pilipes]